MAKRAMFDEQVSPTVFVHQKHYKLKGAEVYLLPIGLCPKRLWSKKYPIVISLVEPSTIDRKLASRDNEQQPANDSLLNGQEQSETPKSTSVDSLSSHLSDSSGLQRRDSQSSTKSNKGREKPEVMYLFARTCRQKEEWFRRFKAASNGQPLPTHLNELLRPRDLNLKSTTNSCLDTSGDAVTILESSAEKEQTSEQCAPPKSLNPEPPLQARNQTEQLLRQYLHYMATLLPEGEISCIKSILFSEHHPKRSY